MDFFQKRERENARTNDFIAKKERQFAAERKKAAQARARDADRAASRKAAKAEHRQNYMNTPPEVIRQEMEKHEKGSLRHRELWRHLKQMELCREHEA